MHWGLGFRNPVNREVPENCKWLITGMLFSMSPNFIFFNFNFLGGQFCVVAKVTMIHMKFSQIWLQSKYESNVKKHPSIFRNLMVFLKFFSNSGY
jgi:hypothetical protein